MHYTDVHTNKHHQHVYAQVVLSGIIVEIDITEANIWTYFYWAKSTA